MSLVLGESVAVIAAKNKPLRGLRGVVVLETMHTITIKTGIGAKATIPKMGSALQLRSGEIVLGDDLEGRLEDRIAVTRRMRKGA